MRAFINNLILALVAFSCTVSNSQEFNKATMDSLFSVIEQKEKGMGSISIFDGDREVYQRTFGFADVENKIPADAATKYRIGSISKTFTATLIMQIVSDGKLTLETTLDKFFPEVENASKITIEHMLRHRSGIFNITSAPDYPTWLSTPTTREELIQKIVAHESVFEPGTKTEYSNSNYLLLTVIAEKIEKAQFGDLLQKKICLPCGLTDTYHGSAISTERNEAKSYTKGKSWVPATETDMSIPLGAGAVVSNPTDLNKFFVCLFNAKIVSESTLKRMMELQDGFGIGMFQMPFFNKRSFGHKGGIDGFQSMASFFVDDDVSIAYTTNAVAMPVNDILIGALSIYFGRDYKFPEFKEALVLAPEQLDQYLGIYSTPAFPLKITVTKKDSVLMAQATGQPSFALEGYEKDKFKFDPAGVKMSFNPAENKMTLTQGGRDIEFKKE